MSRPLRLLLQNKTVNFQLDAIRAVAASLKFSAAIARICSEYHRLQLDENPAHQEIAGTKSATVASLRQERTT